MKPRIAVALLLVLATGAAGCKGAGKLLRGIVIATAVVARAAATAAAHSAKRAAYRADHPPDAVIQACGEVVPPAPAGGACLARVPNIHHEAGCTYFCLEHCSWHVPGEHTPAPPQTGDDTPASAPMPAEPPPIAPPPLTD